MRAIEKKRPPLMNKRRWTVVILLLLVAIITLVTMYYRIIHNDVWQQESDMKRVVEQSTAYDMESIESLNKYVWESTYWILLANNLANNAYTYSAWDEAGLIAELKYDDALTREEMLAIVEHSNNDASNIRLQAGYALGQFVWEVKYRDRNTSHMKIAFYSMTNGSLIDEYTIPKASMPLTN